MASNRGGGSSFLLAISLILLTIYVDVVEGRTDYTWVNTLRIIRIVIPVVILIGVCCGGGYCFKRRKNQARAAQAQADGAPSENPAFVLGPVYHNPSTEPGANPPGYGFNTQYSNLNETTEYKNGHYAPPDFTKPPPTYEEVAEQKKTESQPAANS